MLLAFSWVAVDEQVTVRPVFGLTIEETVMLPAKLLMLAREMDMDAPETPTLKSLGVDETAKSPTWTRDLALWDAVPGEPDPVIVTA